MRARVMCVGTRSGRKKVPSLRDGLVEVLMVSWIRGHGLFRLEDSMGQL